MLPNKFKFKRSVSNSVQYNAERQDAGSFNVWEEGSKTLWAYSERSIEEYIQSGLWTILSLPSEPVSEPIILSDGKRKGVGMTVDNEFRIMWEDGQTRYYRVEAVREFIRTGAWTYLGVQEKEKQVKPTKEVSTDYTIYQLVRALADNEAVLTLYDDGSFEVREFCFHQMQPERRLVVSGNNLDELLEWVSGH